MNADPLHITPQQAREQLAASQARALPSARDRRVHALATAVLGTSIGFLGVTDNLVSGVSGVVLSVAFLAGWIALLVWVERAARTVPRRARRWSYLGIGTSFALTLGLVLPWLNLRAQTEPNTWPMVLLATAVVAAPSLLAAVVITRGRR